MRKQLQGVGLLVAALLVPTWFAGARPAAAQSAPTVIYNVTGSSGNWVLDFSVTNNAGVSGQSLYFFGVKTAVRDIVGSPGGWNSNTWLSWTNTPYGGSSEVYNNNWIFGSIPNGGTASGFKVHTADLVAPATVKWFAFSVGGPDYPGTDNFNSKWN